MAKKAYIGVNGSARKVKKPYIGIDGTARKITRAYVGVNGKAQRCFDLRTMNVSSVSVSPAMQGIYDGAYGNGIYIFVDVLGYWWRSTDGKNWNRYSYASLQYGLRSICFGNGVFCCICNDESGNYYALRSTDGLSWSRTRIFSSGNGSLVFVSFGNGSFVAGGYNSNNKAVIYTSTDGSNFTLTYTSESISRVDSAAYLPGVGFSAGKLFSADGATWIDVSGGPTSLYSGGLCAGGGKFVRLDYTLYTSKNGINWDTSLPKIIVNSMKYKNGIYVGGGGASKIYFSYDGLHYETVDLSGIIGSDKDITAIISDGMKFYVAGQDVSSIAVIEFTEA